MFIRTFTKYYKRITQTSESTSDTKPAKEPSKVRTRSAIRFALKRRTGTTEEDYRAPKPRDFLKFPLGPKLVLFRRNDLLGNANT